MVYQTPKLLPAVFKWEGGGKDIYLAGSFNKWAKIPLVKRFVKKKIELFSYSGHYIYRTPGQTAYYLVF